jgi:hypothetical protein
MEDREDHSGDHGGEDSSSDEKHDSSDDDDNNVLVCLAFTSLSYASLMLLQFINCVPSPRPAATPAALAAPATELGGRSTVRPLLTIQQMQVRLDHMECQVQQAKTFIRNLRRDVMEACRHRNEQNEHLLRIELYMENLSNNFLDETKM